MIPFLLLLLIVLTFLGFIQIPWLPLNLALFVINGQDITILDLLVFLVVLWLIGILPRPFREIGGVLFILWILGQFGIIAIAGFTNIILIAIVVGVAIYLLGGF